MTQIRSKTQTKAFDDNYDRIFRKEKFSVKDAKNVCQTCSKRENPCADDQMIYCHMYEKDQES